MESWKIKLDSKPETTNQNILQKNVVFLQVFDKIESDIWQYFKVNWQGRFCPDYWQGFWVWQMVVTSWEEAKCPGEILHFSHLSPAFLSLAGFPSNQNMFLLVLLKITLIFLIPPELRTLKSLKSLIPIRILFFFRVLETTFT